MNKKTKQAMKEILGVVLVTVVIAVMAISGGVGAYKVVNSLNSSSTLKVQANYNYLDEEIPSYEYLKSVTVQILGCSANCDSFANGTVDCEPSKCWTGTGIVVRVDRKYTYILTNAHVAGKNKTKLSLFVNNENKEIPAELVQYHDTLDLAVLKIKGTLKNKEEIKGVSVAKPQDPVYLVGHHLGRPYVYGEGVFAGYDGIYDIIQIPCAFGNSGSGVFDKEGNVIALVFAINYVNFFSFDTAHAICIDGLSIELFLEQLNLI